MPINVLLLIDSLRMGGAERITVSLLPHFQPDRITPILCTLHTRRQSPLAQQVHNAQLIDLNAKRLLDPRAIQRLVRLIRQEHIDVIHAQLQDATIFAAIAGKICRVPVVVTRHLIDDDNQNIRRRIRNQVEKMAIRWNVTRVVSVSNAAQNAYVQMTGLPLERFQTIYNGIDVDRFVIEDDKQVLRGRLELPTDRPIITMVAVMRPGKGHDVCIEAARRLTDVHFVFVGDGKPPYRAQLEKQAEGLDHIHFLGQRMDVPWILAASDMLVLPSDSEALPTVLIEAGAAGLPVIASRVGGMPEIVDDGITGVIILPQNPDELVRGIRTLIDDPARMRQMGRNARTKMMREFTLSRQADELMTLYEQVARSTPVKNT